MKTRHIGDRQKPRQDAWTEDIEYIRHELPNRHPNLFFHLSKKAFNAKLVEQIATLKKVNQTGSLFIAISPETFSSAVINAMDFRIKTHAILLGRPAGGRPNHYGEVRGLQLPNSKLEVYHATKYFKFINEDPPAVEPDMVVENRFSDFEQGTDPIYEYVRSFEGV